MKYALGVMQLGSDEALFTRSFVRQYAKAAEDAGFDGIFFTEHPIPDDRWLATGGHDALDPFVALSFVAAATERVRLITNLTVLPYRNPFLLAKSVATLDLLSDGRVTLGVGVGYLQGEYDALGVDHGERNELFDEVLEVARKAWTGKSVQHNGKHFTAKGNTARPTPIQAHIPVWVGGNSTLSLRRVATTADGWIPLHNPASLGNRRRSPSLEGLDDLEAYLGRLKTLRAEAGRADAPLDVMWHDMFGIVSDGEKAKLRDDLHRQAELGITWNSVTCTEHDPTSILAFIDSFGDKIIRG
ncbi:MAG: LLM class F420-dependent oxidoreductase [Acidimicrobiia bacterium]